MLKMLMTVGSIVVSSQSPSSPCSVETLRKQAKQEYDQNRTMRVLDETGKVIGTSAVSQLRLGSSLLKVGEKSFLPSVYLNEIKLNDGTEMRFEHTELRLVDLQTCATELSGDGDLQTDLSAAD